MGGFVGNSFPSGRVLAQSCQAVALTGSTNETTLATIAIPAGLLQTNGKIVVSTIWSFTGSTNAKTKRVKLGTTAFMAVATTGGTSVTLFREFAIFARGRASQLAILSSAPSGQGAQTSANTTGTENLDSDLNLTITGQLASAGETLTLEAYTVSIVNP